MPAFVSDAFFDNSNPDEDGHVNSDIAVSTWLQFDTMVFHTRIWVLDLDFMHYLSESGRPPTTSIEDEFREHFRKVFSELYDRALTHLTQGGVILVLINEEAPVPRDKSGAYSSASTIAQNGTSSHEWLYELGVSSGISRVGSTDISIEVNDSVLEQYLRTCGDLYSISLGEGVEDNSKILATSQSGDPVAVEVGRYLDESGNIRSDGGRIVFLPSTRTWKQNPMMSARYLKEIGEKRLSGDTYWRRYEEGADIALDIRIVERVLKNFEHAVGALSSVGGETQIQFTNEKDVQALLDAGLRLYFDDVGREVPLGEHAGSAGIIDFLVRDVAAGIEVKATRESRSQSELVAELEKAKASYGSSNLVEHLFIFVYVMDPSHLSDIMAMRRDIEGPHTTLVIVPK